MAKHLIERYNYFARYEAHGISPLYESFAIRVASDDVILEFLSSLPTSKQQPNLLFAAVREVCGVASSSGIFAEYIKNNFESVRSTMLSRSTQTNEPARCATLLPLFAQFPQPLALIEVGASAGLCLFPDRYSYTYQTGEHQTHLNKRENTPHFVCQIQGNVPIPKTLPNIVWRAGIDLNPLDLENQDQTDWLETLIWPEQLTRCANFKEAVKIVRKEPPRIIKANLLHTLPDLIRQAPKDATLVIFHSAVLSYVSKPADRKKFMAIVTDSSATWVSNEHPSVFPELTSGLDFEPANNQFLLCENGQPIASTGPHGQSIDWFR